MDVTAGAELEQRFLWTKAQGSTSEDLTGLSDPNLQYGLSARLHISYFKTPRPFGWGMLSNVNLNGALAFPDVVVALGVRYALLERFQFGLGGGMSWHPLRTSGGAAFAEMTYRFFKDFVVTLPIVWRIGAFIEYTPYLGVRIEI